MAAKTIEMTEALATAAATINAEFLPKPAGYAAVPYVRALMALPIGATAYFEDDLETVLIYLLGNLTYWRGPVAKETKETIKAALAEAKG